MKRGKCERCCPDGGAIFSESYDEDMRPIWKCNNCHLTKKRSSYKTKSDKPTPSQTATLERLLRRSNATIKTQELIGRKLFVSFSTGGNVFTDKEWTGTIGPKGAIDLTYYYFGGSLKVTEEYLVN